MLNQTFTDRLNNPGVVRVYAHMIRTSPVDTVKELYNNLKEHAHDHPKFTDLEKLYKERIN
jgi:hypothetical protein